MRFGIWISPGSCRSMWGRSKSGSQAYVPLVFDPGEACQFGWSHEYAVVAIANYDASMSA